MRSTWLRALALKTIRKPSMKATASLPCWVMSLELLVWPLATPRSFGESKMCSDVRTRSSSGSG